MKDQKVKPKSGRRIQVWQIAGFILMLVAAGVAVWGFWPVITGTSDEDARDVGEELEEARAAIEVIVLDRGEFPLRAEAHGHLSAWRRAEISVESSGIILSRPIEEGQSVQKGDLLLQIDDRQQQIQLKEAEDARLAALAEYAVKRNREDLQARDTTALAAARARFRQAADDFAQGLLAEEELESARRNFEGEDLLSGKLRDAVAAVTYNLAQSEQQLERARLELSRTRLLAPFSGRVADLTIEAGQHVGAGTNVLTLLEDDRMKVSVNVLEVDLVRTRVGVTANVLVPNYSTDFFTGTVYSINPSVDPGKGFGRVTVALSNPGGRLVTGLHADVALEVDRLQDRLVVPASALLVRQGRDLIFKIQDGRAYWTYVIVGARSGNFAEISSAPGPGVVEKGDSVLVAGHEALAHDTPVEVIRVRDLGLQ